MEQELLGMETPLKPSARVIVEQHPSSTTLEFMTFPVKQEASPPFLISLSPSDTNLD